MSSPTVLVNLPDRSDDIGTAVSIDLRTVINDADSGDSLTYSISGLPGGTGLSLNSSTGVLTGTPTAADAADSPITVTITATDDGANQNTVTLNLSVTPSGGGEDPSYPTPPDNRGVGLIWYGNTNAELDKPYIKFGQCYSQLSNVYNNANFTSPSYSTMTADVTALDSATGGPKSFTIQLNAQKDNSMKQRVWYLNQAKATYGEQKVELDGDWIAAFWDAAGDGVELMKDCADASFAAYDDMLTTEQQTRCIGIRFAVSAIAVESQAPSTAAGQLIANYTKGSSANATTPANYSTALRNAAIEEYWQHVIDTAFPDGTDDPPAYPISLRPKSLNLLSSGLQDDHDAAWNNNRMGILITSWTEEPYNAEHEEQAIKFFDVCRVNGNLKGLCEAFDENPGSHATVNPTNYSALQRKYWGILFCLHIGATYIYLRPQYTSLYGTGSENQREWKAMIDFANTYAGWHLDPGNAPGAWLALREGNRFTSADAGGGNYSHHMTQITTGGGDRGTELWAGNQPNPSSDYVGRPSSTSGSTTDAGTGQRQSIWAFSFSTSEVLKLELDSTFATSIDGDPITVRVHYLDVGSSATFQTAVFGSNLGVTALTGTNDWIVREFSIPSPTVSTDGDGAHIVITPSTAAVAFHMVEVIRG